MPIYRNLSQVRANEILRLADASFQSESEFGQEFYDADDIIRRLSEPPRPERAALLDELDSLSHSEALDLVGIMYVGRGDYIDVEEDSVQVVEAFNAQLSDFARQSSDDLVRICAEKDLAFHIYLRKGMALLA